ncbi:hypothetical protein QJS04_geneDACA018317 [Acorus gramineus]|uniref:DUF7722 domain-containing protein n=1 Tax=Acorus gramineus TaxID=55184 RepID=A0AAV9BAU6_ACOGR|nr:hypothetical protein QJS04_geneDACA018317 [Acorus gramineus]
MRDETNHGAPSEGGTMGNMYNERIRGDNRVQTKRDMLEKNDCVNGVFRMPLHYPRYKKKDYEVMEEWKTDLTRVGICLRGLKIRNLDWLYRHLLVNIDLESSHTPI